MILNDFILKRLFLNDLIIFKRFYYTMSVTTIPIASNFPIMSTIDGNFNYYEDRLLKEICIIAGPAGEQLRTGKPIVMRFSAKPTINDFTFDNETGEPLYPVYKRDTTNFTFDEAATEAILPITGINSAWNGIQTRSMARASGIPTMAGTTITSVSPPTATTNVTLVKQFNAKFWKLPLTDAATALFEKHIQLYETTLTSTIASDGGLLHFIQATHSLASKTAIEASPLFAPYPDNCTDKSLRYWNISKSVHQAGSGTIKFGRINNIFQMTQGDTTHAEFIIAIAQAQKTLSSDFGQVVNMPGHELHGETVINVNHIMSMIYLGGIDQQFFAYPIFKLLEQHPDGRVKDCAALTHLFHQHSLAHAKDPSTSTARALTAKVGGPTAPTSTATATTATTATNAKTSCTICAALGFRTSKHNTIDCEGKVGGAKYDKVYHDKRIIFARDGFHKGTFGKSSKASANVAATTAVAVPVGPTGGVFDTDPYKRASAYLSVCPVGTQEWLNAAAALADIVTPQDSNKA